MSLWADVVWVAIGLSDTTQDNAMTIYGGDANSNCDSSFVIQTHTNIARTRAPTTSLCIESPWPGRYWTNRTRSTLDITQTEHNSGHLDSTLSLTWSYEVERRMQTYRHLEKFNDPIKHDLAAGSFWNYQIWVSQSEKLTWLVYCCCRC